MDVSTLAAKLPAACKHNGKVKAECVDWPGVLDDFNQFLPMNEQWVGPMTPLEAKLLAADEAGTYMLFAAVPLAVLDVNYADDGRYELFAYYVGTSDAPSVESGIGSRIYDHTGCKDNGTHGGRSALKSAAQNLHEGLLQRNIKTLIMLSRWAALAILSTP